jgi:hypothetical protein
MVLALKVRRTSEIQRFLEETYNVFFEMDRVSQWSPVSLRPLVVMILALEVRYAKEM